MSVRQAVRVRRVMAGGVAAAAVLWFGGAAALTARAQQVFDQVPSDAVAVLKVHNLQHVSDSTARLAKQFGLDELRPEFKDPLGALMQQAHISKGVNKSGDLAIAGFDNDNNDGEALVLIPVDDYNAFLGNFEADGAAEGGIQKVKNPQNGGSLYVMQRGKYAAMSEKKDRLIAPAGGLKLGTAAQREADAKDAVVFVNMPIIGKKVLPQMQQHRDEFMKSFGNAFEAQPQMKAFAPVIKTLASKFFDVAQQFMTDSQGIVISLNLGDKGIMISSLGEFTPNSPWGQNVAQMKNTDQPLLAGLPDRQYFAFGGAMWNPQLASQLSSELIDPIRNDLGNANAQGKEIANMLDAFKTMIAATNSTAAGYVVPQAIGNESIVQTVVVTTGEAKTIDTSEKSILQTYTGLLSNMPGGIKMKMEPQPQKTVNGVTLDAFRLTVQADANDPQAVQAQQMMTMFYGPNGLTTYLGVVNPKTYLVVQGGGEQLLNDAVTAAKSGASPLAQNAAVQGVTSELPKQRFAEDYVALDNIISTALKYAQMFGLPIRVKVPANLPPLGISVGSDGPALRGDLYIPSQTVQSLISAGLQGYQQMHGANGGV